MEKKKPQEEIDDFNHSGTNGKKGKTRSISTYSILAIIGVAIIFATFIYVLYYK